MFTVVAEAKKALKKTTAGWSTLDSKSALPTSGLCFTSRSLIKPRIKEEEREKSPPSKSSTKKKGGLMTATDIAAEQAALAEEREWAEAIKLQREGHDEEDNLQFIIWSE